MSSLPLLYPFSGLTSLEVGPITNTAIKLISNQIHWQDGSIAFRLLGHITKQTPETLAPISLIDARRAFYAAWCLTHNAQTYRVKKYCQCGELLMVSHPINCNDYKRTNIYDAPQTVSAAGQDYKVKLRPMGLEFHTRFISAATQAAGGQAKRHEEQWVDYLLKCQVDSVNGQSMAAENAFDDYPVSLTTAIRTLVAEDTKATTATAQKTSVCGKCKTENTTQVDWYDGPFLQGEA